MPILLKVYRCFCDGLKMFMWFGYYPQINFCHIFSILNLVIFEAQIVPNVCILDTLVCTTSPTVLCLSFLNFTGVFVMIRRCAYGLDVID